MSLLCFYTFLALITKTSQAKAFPCLFAFA
jgi:hypothetical protein